MGDDSREIQEPQDNPESAKVDLLQELEASQAEAEQWLDRYRRSAAELANYRKRVERDREQQFLRSQMALMRQLLPIVDDFDLALKNIPQDEQNVSWAEGIRLIRNKLEALLKDSGVETIEAEGQPFDPLYHDALMQEESDEYPDGIVSEEIRKGYIMGDEVLRPTLVKVSRGSGS